VRLPAVVEAAQGVPLRAEPQEAEEVPDEPLVVVTEVAQDALREAEEVPDEPLVVVTEVAQDALREAVGAPDELLAVVAEQDGPREVEEVRVEPQAEVQASAAEPSVALQALSLLAARLARQHKTLRLRVSVVTTSEGSRSQSLRAVRIEFVSWRPVREKQSNNVSFVSFC
jgi:hypothetical protein